MGILKITRLQCKDAETRRKTINALRPVIDDVISEQHGVAQFLVTIPLEDASEAELYIIEEFTSQAAIDSYCATKRVKDFESRIHGNEILSEPPEVHKCPIAIKKISGPPLPLSANPAILLVGMEYNQGKSSNAVAGWIDMAEGAVQSVPGVNVFTVAEDKGTSSVRTVEVLDSWESLSVLVKTDAAKKNVEHNGKDRTGVKSAVKVHAIAGFVGRS